MGENKIIYLPWFMLEIWLSIAEHTDKIVGGTVARYEHWRFIVSVQIHGAHHCGGSFFTRDCVITAGHCVVNKAGQQYPVSFFTVKAGITDLKAVDAIDVKVMDIKVYPEYDYKDTIHDIALLKLDHPVLDQRVEPVTIMRGVNLPTLCFAAGWGYTNPIPVQYERHWKFILNKNTTIKTWRTKPRPKEEDLSSILLEVPLPTITEMDCKNRLGIHWTVVCTLADNRDTCMGDSGGPLMCDNILCGITSFGYGCGSHKFPSVFSNVSHYAKWLDKNCYKDSDIPTTPGTITSSYTTTSNGPTTTTNRPSTTTTSVPTKPSRAPVANPWVFDDYGQGYHGHGGGGGGGGGGKAVQCRARSIWTIIGLTIVIYYLYYDYLFCF